MAVKAALLSVSDKTGIVDLAKGLAKMGVTLYSTGGTARAIREAGLDVVDVSDITGFPECLDGRVKTLHPKVHGALLYMRDNEEHRRQKEELDIPDIDMVVVNLYPFRETIAKPDCTLEDAIENIDIGGPTMLRSAAKNWPFVTVVVDPGDYRKVLDEMRQNGGDTVKETRFLLATKVFAHTCSYDTAIANYLEGRQGDGKMPSTLRIEASKALSLRYGENPHQQAAFYALPGAKEPGATTARQLSGKELSFNNIIDLHAAIEIVKEIERPTCAVIKHTNPCGAAVAEVLSAAFENAYAGDPVSAFGSIVAFNREVDEDTAEKMTEGEKFVEAVIAPAFSGKAFSILTTKPKWGKNVRLMETGPLGVRDGSEVDMKRVTGGILVQERDLGFPEFDQLKVVTEAKPSEKQMEDLKFAWVICKHVKSNTILLAKDGMVVGVGAGQMSRVDSSIIAARKAGERSMGAVLASDAFFPFPDAVEAAAEAGVAAMIQPGGAKRDEDVIAACNKLGIPMVFTGRRHFKH
ncbi:MAG: bifunctional phosphoribosylaminoimidazolecarboxamide formyltransferase/IMP cyclohydrolase [Planctomycetes bacterium]|nr:bifunctional phosphoribosylaminoimidazolecarboxamide formyltransferase/IMP cyclohydrolase [Planctomycetota bacterium]